MLLTKTEPSCTDFKLHTTGVKGEGWHMFKEARQITTKKKKKHPPQMHGQFEMEKKTEQGCILASNPLAPEKCASTIAESNSWHKPSRYI